MKNASVPEVYAHYAAITKHDSTNFPDGECDAIWSGDAAPGDIVAVRADGTTVMFKSVPAGTELRIRARRVNSTNTTATNMVALYRRKP